MYYVQYSSYLGNPLGGVGLSDMMDIGTGKVIKHYPHSVVGIVFWGKALLVNLTFNIIIVYFL